MEVSRAKLAAPAPRAGAVPRPRLDGLLDGHAEAPLLAVTAPGGYGKTIAAAAWLGARGHRHAWVSLDESDNDPALLWSSIAGAVQRAVPGPQGAAVELTGPAGLPVEQVVDGVLDRLADDGRRLRLVLDDLHLIEDPRALRSLARAVGNAPPNLSVVVLGRDHVAASALGCDASLEHEALAFTLDEARSLLNDVTGLGLADDDIATLVARTEGWPAALSLAAMWLREVPDPAGAVPRFTGGHEHVADYLVGEVLGTLDSGVRRFLAETSVLRRFSVQLCDHVRERGDSKELLDRVERSNLFLVPLDRAGGWFRYHAMFRELVRVELERDDRRAPGRLLERAAAWFAERGDVVDALEHAGDAGDMDTVADLLDAHHLALVRSGRARTLLSWLARLPDDAIVARPVLAVTGAFTADLWDGPAGAGRRLLGLAELSRAERAEIWTQREDATLATLRANAIDDDVDALVGAARRAVDLAVGEGEQWSVAARSLLAYALLLSGDVEGARRAGEAVLRHPSGARRPYGHIGALGVLALVAITDEDLARARELTDRALHVAEAAGLSDAVMMPRVHRADALLLARAGDLDGAERAAQAALQCTGMDAPGLRRAGGLLTLAEVQAAGGAVPAARATLGEARSLVGAARRPGVLAAEVERIGDALDHREGDSG